MNRTEASANAPQSFPLTHDTAACIMSNTALYKEANTMPKKDTLRKAAYEKENVKRYALKLNVKYDA